MKPILALAGLTIIAVALAAPQYYVAKHHEPHHHGGRPVLLREIPLTSADNNVGYDFGYELSDGQSRRESARIEPKRGTGDAVLRVSGSYSWVNPEDGQTYTVTYVADENGFQPQGAHLPKV